MPTRTSAKTAARTAATSAVPARQAAASKTVTQKRVAVKAAAREAVAKKRAEKKEPVGKKAVEKKAKAKTAAAGSGPAKAAKPAKAVAPRPAPGRSQAVTGVKRSPATYAASARAKTAAKNSASSSAAGAGTAETAKVAETAKAVEPGPPVQMSASDLVDTQLAKYRSMRDFNVTQEPSGAGGDAVEPAPWPAVARAPAGPASAKRALAGRAKVKEGLPFVIQKHAASHLHYDFRLGWSGVLKSWAVAKGPSYVVADRRLAVQVEDHPMEYGGFEGIIPHGQYGGGTVMVWDQGTWWPQLGHENVEAGLRTGSLKFEMNGTKMRGKWTLIRMHTTRPYGGENSRWKSNDKPQWLLIKEHDEFERPATAPPVVDIAPNSALTGRTMDEIAQEQDHVWNSKETAGQGQAWFRQEAAEAEGQPHSKEQAVPAAAAKSPHTAAQVATTHREDAKPALRIAPRPRPAVPPGPTPRSGAVALSPKLTEALDDLPREPQPEFLAPQLAQETETPPEGPGWVHELKLDGYRMQARKSARGVQMLTRSGIDWTYRVPAVAEAVARLPFASFTLDGEVVVLAEDGNTNFADLQASFQNGEKHPLTFFCFDLLHLEGRNPRNLSLRERKKLLAEMLPQDDSSIVRLSEHIESNGRQMFERACQLHAEGIISKRAEEAYQVGRRSDWLKSKCLHEQEFVIGGFTLSSDGPDRIGSLLIGYYPSDASKSNDPGKLIYAGRTGTGFTQKQRRELRAQLASLESKTHAYAHLPAEARRDHPLWVRPELVAQVRFATWTAENFVRQAAFLGLREDKRPGEVFREEATVAPLPKSNERKQPVFSAKSAPQEATTEPASSASRSATPAKPLTAAPVRLTHPKKVLDPESALTKQQLADYYWAVADRMLPHIADRPLSLVRCPEGAGKPCFYQKHVNSMLPPGIGSVMVADKKGGAPEPYITLNTREALSGLAQMGVLEVHPWSSQNEHLECPDRLIFDLDPDEALTWSTVVAAAHDVKERLKKAGLDSFVKTTGGKGLHIVAPIVPEHEFATVKELAHRFVLAMEKAEPRLYLTRMTKAARTGKIYLDYLRNERGATAVAPFSPRARAGITASVPLDWKELNTPERPRFAVAEFASWQERLRRDPWKRIGSLSQRLDPVRIR